MRMAETKAIVDVPVWRATLYETIRGVTDDQAVMHDLIRTSCFRDLPAAHRA